ncbi:hypothetical protein ACFQPF_04940 [Fictibacillus iocasae]|uniref:Uncharacterized protein n=1 Tax=Fictibacillus iocasae TaxID=2715437 RepID=A0ABW2NKL6_9BACL
MELNKWAAGFVFVLTGFIFLVISFALSESTVLWAISLGASIVLNIAGTAMLVQSIKSRKESI